MVGTEYKWVEKKIRVNSKIKRNNLKYVKIDYNYY